MSFAMDFRRESAAQRKAAEYTHALDAIDSTSSAKSEKRIHRLSVLGALCIAAAVLGLFNSAALVQYSYKLSESDLGIRVLEVSEEWHELMQQKRLTMVVERIRDAVGTARQSQWQDLTFGFMRTADSDDDTLPPSTMVAEDTATPGAYSSATRY